MSDEAHPFRALVLELCTERALRPRYQGGDRGNISKHWAPTYWQMRQRHVGQKDTEVDR